MVRTIKAELALQLRNQSLSRPAIESSQGIFRPSIQAVLDAADRLGLGCDDVAELSEAEVNSTLFPGRGVRESVFAQPDWARVHTELASAQSMTRGSQRIPATPPLALSHTIGGAEPHDWVVLKASDTHYRVAG